MTKPATSKTTHIRLTGKVAMSKYQRHQIERETSCAIEWALDDGCGGATLWLKPQLINPDKSDRARMLEAARKFGAARWEALLK